jgi:hypothetical protein
MPSNTAEKPIMTWTKSKPPLIECFPLWKNDSTRYWVVQKFGGTSVGKLAVEIVEDVVRYASLGTVQGRASWN